MTFCHYVNLPFVEEDEKESRSGYRRSVRRSSLKSFPLMNHKDEFKYYPTLFEVI